MATVPIPEPQSPDIFSLGFDKNLSRTSTSSQSLGEIENSEVVYQSVEGTTNAATIENGSILAGWTIANDTLQSPNGNIVLDAKNNKITVGPASAQIVIDSNNQKITIGDSKIVLDAANKRMLISDGSDDRILIGYQSGGF